MWANPGSGSSEHAGGLDVLCSLGLSTFTKFTIAPLPRCRLHPELPWRELEGGCRLLCMTVSYIPLTSSWVVCPWAFCWPPEVQGILHKQRASLQTEGILGTVSTVVAKARSARRGCSFAWSYGGRTGPFLWTRALIFVSLFGERRPRSGFWPSVFS